MKNLLKSICIICILLLMVLSSFPQVAKADEVAYDEARYFQVWTYIGEGVPVPFSQTIVARVGYNYEDWGNKIRITKSSLTGIAENGVHYPFEEIIFLIYVKWYKNGSLYKELTSFSRPGSGIYDPNDIIEVGENYTSFDLLYSDTWYQEGQIEVYAPETLEMWRLYNVTNYN